MSDIPKVREDGFDPVKNCEGWHLRPADWEMHAHAVDRDGRYLGSAAVIAQIFAMRDEILRLRGER